MINRRENWIGGLPAEIRAQFDACGQARAYAPGQEICRAGQAATAIHQVLEGYIKVTGLTTAGETAIVVIYGPGNCWGESPIIAERAHHHTTTAMTPARVRHIPRADFLRLYNEHSAVSTALCRKFCVSMSQLIHRGETQARDRISRLVARAFLSFVDGAATGEETNARGIDLPLTQTDLANYLGVTRQSVQPEIAALRRAGILEKQGSAWRVHDIARLRRWSRETA